LLDIRGSRGRHFETGRLPHVLMHVPFSAFDVDGGGVARSGARLVSGGGALLRVEEVSNKEEPGGGRRIQDSHTLNSQRFRQPYVRRHEMARPTVASE
jgi:hypothetical protein